MSSSKATKNTIYSIVFATVLLSLLIELHLTTTRVVEAVDAEPTMAYDLMKKLSDPYPDGLSADQFTFDIVGTSASGTALSLLDIDLNAFTVDTATAVVNLPRGRYTITENGPIGFVPGEWTIQWSNAKGCVQQSGDETLIIIDDDNFGLANVGCRADNQWRPGRLTVEKQFVGTTSPYENFSFRVTQDSGLRFEGVFDANDGINEVTIAAGSYKVEELTSTSSVYTTTYSGDCASDGTGNIEQGGRQTCTITNTYNGSQENSSSTGTIIIEKRTNPTGTTTAFTFSPSWSGGDFSLHDGEQSIATNLATGTYSVIESVPTGWVQASAVCSDGSLASAISLQAEEIVTCVFTNTLISEADTFRIEGYVWHDDNENTNWDGFGEDEPEVLVEEAQSGWTVQITNGTNTLSTTTDSSGFYYFEVSAGTWTITQTLIDGWTLITPVSGSFEVTVPPASLVQNSSLLQRILASLVNTAEAALVGTYGPYNFGNNESVGGGGSGSGSGGGGSGSGGSSRSGGSSNKVDTGSGGNLTLPDPTPQVLGESITVMPVGAPRTGFGGNSTNFGIVSLYSTYLFYFLPII